MGSVGASGNGGIWGMGRFHDNLDKWRRNNKRRNSGKGEAKSSTSGDASAATPFRFPVKQALTAASLALTGDTIAQLRQRWLANKQTFSRSQDFEIKIGQPLVEDIQNSIKDTATVTSQYTENIARALLSEHDWIRALRMTSYGFLLYGPGSYAWYQYLDHCMPKQTVENLMMKVLLNQIILGPSVIAVVFAWNNLWQGKLAELPNKYRKDALPTLFTGFRFWIPVSILNFWVVPLHSRVAFMSMGSIFWNFYLSSTMSR